jgi:DNA (cytosine-5)-methyltransferase 1
MPKVTASTVVSLFSGIGGIELGLSAAGFKPLLFCEADVHAQAVLRQHWPDVEISDDVRTLSAIPPCDVITAGFPCQDLSQAGNKAGITGKNSGLVEHLFRLLSGLSFEPEWIVIENVPYMLSLNNGHAMEHVLDRLEGLGFKWAYRSIDARAFGIPQRRVRVVLLASRVNDPTAALWTDNTSTIADLKPANIEEGAAYGFYWTEGSRGLGWVKNAIPPIKGGSGLGIPSAPAIWRPKLGQVGKPVIEDGERLQGFPAGWTEAAVGKAGGRVGARWRLVGNAVNVEMAKWIGVRLSEKRMPVVLEEGAIRPDKPYPASAHGFQGRRRSLALNQFPVIKPMIRIEDFLELELQVLSQKAALGFLHRALTTPKLVYAPDFLDFLKSYCGIDHHYWYGGIERIALSAAGKGARAKF